MTPVGAATGAVLPVLTVRVTADDLARWAMVTGDDTAFHVDVEAARELGFERPVVHGPWKSAVLMRMLADWAGPGADVERLSCRYRRPDLLDDELSFGGEVMATRRENCADVVEVRVWVTGAEEQISLEGEALVRFSADPVREERELPLDEVRSSVRLGEVAGRFTYRVEAGDVERFVEAVTDVRPVAGELARTAPPTFFAALDPVERRDLDLDGLLQHLPYPMVGGGNAFNEVEYERPIRVGDVITVATTYTDVYEKDGRAGRLLFRVRDNELCDETGALVARTRCGHVLAFDLSDDSSGTVGA